MNISFFGSSLVSAYWNGAATYYRGILHALARHHFDITFYEPDAFDRQRFRDIPDPDWARVVVYPPDEKGVLDALTAAKRSDVVVKASGVGVNDALLDRAVLDLKVPGSQVVFWDVDAPATLQRVFADAHDPFRECIPEYDTILTYGGGPPVVNAYLKLGARDCRPIYNGLDPETHHPAPSRLRFASSMAFMGNRLPDREARVREFFFTAAEWFPQESFLLGGSGWEADDVPANVTCIGHVSPQDHNAFNCTPKVLLNISRESMARYGYSPATRVFEAAGAGACLITDAWTGVEHFFEPGHEWLVAPNGNEVAALLAELSPDRAGAIGEAARERALRDHTYAQRAEDVLAALGAEVFP